MSISNHPVEQEELMAYLDGELAADRAAETAAHLEQCAHCQRLAADLREVSQMLTAWKVEEAEHEFQQIAAVLHERSQEKPYGGGVKHEARLGFHLGNRFLWAGGLAAVVVLVLVMSIPNLLRSPFSAHQAAQRAREREKAEQQESRSGLQDVTRSSGGLRSPKPEATPRPGYGTLGKLQRYDQQANEEQETPTVPAVNGPMIIRTADLQVTTNAFDKARAAVEEILQRHHGYVGELNVYTPTGSARSLTGTLRVPANQLEAALSDLKALGRTEKESQGGEEVTPQYVDLEARLANARHTEQRLTDMLRERTGKLSDVLAVEMQISRVRGEIEQMEAQRKTMKNQVDYATVTVTVTEEYKAEIKAVPPSTGTQFRNAAVEGYRSLVDGIIAVLLWLLSAGPTLLLWAAILFLPARMAWKRLRPRFAASK